MTSIIYVVMFFSTQTGPVNLGTYADQDTCRIVAQQNGARCQIQLKSQE